MSAIGYVSFLKAQFRVGQKFCQIFFNQKKDSRLIYIFCRYAFFKTPFFLLKNPAFIQKAYSVCVFILDLVTMQIVE